MWYKFLLCLALSLSSCFAQKKAWDFAGYFNFGGQIFLYDLFQLQGFPGGRLYAALGVSGVKGGFLVNYGPSVSVYTKTIGANLNPMVSDIQVDFTNSFSMGTVWGSEITYVKRMRTLHNGDYYNLILGHRNAVVLSTNFILNNHGRNQAVGALNMNFGNFTFYYYNDGGPPIEWLSTGDKFDRYWTGGGGVFFHSNKGYNIVELGFDQFTGYKPLLYEMSNILGIKVPLYDQPIGKPGDNSRPPNYNTSSYYLKLQFDPLFSFDVGVVGSLVDKRGKFWSVQDNIHLMFGNSLHPNNDNNRWYFGGSFNQSSGVVIK